MITAHILADSWLVQQEGPKFVVLAAWKRTIATQYTPQLTHGPSGDPMGTFFQLGHYVSTVYAGGSYVAGSGEAWDIGLSDYLSVTTAEGSVVDNWKYGGALTPDIEVLGYTAIAGVATVHDNDGAAAAMGFVKYESPAKMVERKIDRAAGASSSSLIGSIQVGSGLQLGIGVGASVGEGSYPDQKPRLLFLGYKQVGVADFTHTSSGHIYVWANGTPPAGLGESSATLAGYVESVNTLADF